MLQNVCLKYFVLPNYMFLNCSIHADFQQIIHKYNDWIMSGDNFLL